MMNIGYDFDHVRIPDPRKGGTDLVSLQNIPNQIRSMGILKVGGDDHMGAKRKLSGGFLVVAGYLLSPLSWWNDLYLNIPLSYGFAWLVSLLYAPAFLAAFIAFYWITNIAGLIMMHKGAGRIMKKRTEPYSKKELLIDLALSIGYTILIIALVQMDVIGPAPMSGFSPP
jgi:hypothetical protein